MIGTKKIKKGQIADFISDSAQTALDAKQNTLAYTPENVANKSTTTTLGTSDTLYPTQNAVKTYVDGKVKRTMYLRFPIFQNVAASTSWYALPSTGQILAGTGYAVNAAITDTNDFANLAYATPRTFCPFQHKIKSVEIHGSTNLSPANPVTFAVVSSYEPIANSGVLVISNPLVVAKEDISIWVSGSGNGFQKKFSDANLVTTTRNAGTDYRIVFKNANEASNLQRVMIIVELEEVL
jgi:hypothetical protein